jgi:6-phosphogluconate dehydrogenase
MKLGFIGLGRMGKAIVYRVIRGGHDVIGYDPNSLAIAEAEKIGVYAVSTIDKVAEHARIIWIMVPAGDPVDAVIKELQPHMLAGDIIIDGGNSKFTDSIRRAEELKKSGIFFIDCGTSGGLRGQGTGFSLMIGGDRMVYEKIIPLLQAIAAPSGCNYMGPSGTGHYVKMVHNGIEYALLQAYAEGFHVLKAGHFTDLNLADIASVWRNGSVIRSWILELAHEVFLNDQTLADISGEVAESGMGRWTVEEAQEHNIPTQLIEDALEIRFWSEKTGGNYATKIVAMLRNKFGGHHVKKIAHKK